MSWDTVIGLVALFISLVSLSLAVVFYFKSNNLYKEMFRFITEIRQYTQTIYGDMFGLVKDGWQRAFDQREEDELAKLAEKRMEKIKGEISEELKKQLDVLQKSDAKDVTEMKEKISGLEKLWPKRMDEVVEKIETTYKPSIRQISWTDIDRLIIVYAAKEKFFTPLQLFAHIREKGHWISPGELRFRLEFLREKGQMNFKEHGGYIDIIV